MHAYPLYGFPYDTMTDEENNSLNQMAVLREEIRDAQRIAQKLTGLLSSQGFYCQALTTVARLKIQHRSWHERFLLANRHKHEALGHLQPMP